MTDEVEESEIEVEVEVEVEVEETVYDFSNFGDVFSVFWDEISDEKLKGLISDHIEKLVKDSGITGYDVIFLYDDDNSINSYHSNGIYHAVKDLNKKKNILMIVHFGGGQIEPAYLISKTCKRLSKTKFNAAIPRRAKSAATLISLGAAEIHMGLLSELGPIDPQFGGFPALGLSNAMEKIAEMSEQYPNASAAQYAERLWSGKDLPDGKTPETLADHFTNHYKDHGCVIDADEASSLLGKKIVKEGSKEYEFSNSIYDFFGPLQYLFGAYKNKNMRYVGSIKSGMDLTEKEEK